ncbi:MAG: hypothetical protein GX073_03385, partial [Firmicutes bacterium]|nr:hypothetical protein [Bacillota bacterium]
ITRVASKNVWVILAPSNGLIAIMNWFQKVSLNEMSGKVLTSQMIYPEKDNPFVKLERFDTIQEVKDWLVALYNKLLDTMELYYLDENLTDVTRAAVRFIQRNYQKPIGLLHIADAVGVNCSYISK